MNILKQVDNGCEKQIAIYKHHQWAHYSNNKMLMNKCLLNIPNYPLNQTLAPG